MAIVNPLLLSGVKSQFTEDKANPVDVAMKHLHIHRGRVADVFLDTPECNAHTTAADILWSGTPVITFPKYDFKMCSRVAASIAYATGSWDPMQGNPFADKGPRGLAHGPSRLAEPNLLGHQMVVNTYEEYEERAVEFGNGMWWDWQQIRFQSRFHANGTPMRNNTGSNSSLSTPPPLLSASSTSSSSSSSSLNLSSAAAAIKQNVLPVPARSDSKPSLSIDTNGPLQQKSQLRSQPVVQQQHRKEKKQPQRGQRFPTNVNPFYPSRSHATHMLVPRGPVVLLRQRLFLTRHYMPLFQTDRWVRNLEMGMLMAWRRWEAGWKVMVERNQEELQAVSTYASTGTKVMDSSPLLELQRRSTTRCLWIDDTYPIGTDSNAVNSTSGASTTIAAIAQNSNPSNNNGYYANEDMGMKDVYHMYK